MIPKKLDEQTANELKKILKRLNVNKNRIIIDFDKEILEVEEDDYSIDDLLEAAGVLTPERSKELLDEVKRSREDWD